MGLSLILYRPWRSAQAGEILREPAFRRVGHMARYLYGLDRQGIGRVEIVLTSLWGRARPWRGAGMRRRGGREYFNGMTSARFRR
ncbi:hypothetical protein C7R54_27310 [Achromobacter aloeverae]|uniref:Uncharacterized protein n=1 Tax=Achromobacter aloeverae TaxID=1750518 RepID=A0A4Q1HC35_9BURK|nr:hypothetical protein C7R54_27310 [Achromobacter aloeverae]